MRTMQILHRCDCCGEAVSGNEEEFVDHLPLGWFAIQCGFDWPGAGQMFCSPECAIKELEAWKKRRERKGFHGFYTLIGASHKEQLDPRAQPEGSAE